MRVIIWDSINVNRDNPIHVLGENFEKIGEVGCHMIFKAREHAEYPDMVVVVDIYSGKQVRINP